MLVKDIVQNAASESGVVSSFNVDELPQETLETGYGILKSKVLPELNCDRSIDITTTSRTYMPSLESNGEYAIHLQPIPDTWEGVDLGDTNTLPSNSNYTSASLTDTTLESNSTLTVGAYNFWLAVKELKGDDYELTINQYTGIPETSGIWSQDGYFIERKYALNENYDPTDTNSDQYISTLSYVYGDRKLTQKVNIPFAPMYISAIINDNDRGTLKYVYTEEFENSDYHKNPYVYTTEDYEDCVKIRLNSSDKKVLILPVPLTIVKSKSNDVYGGEILAPSKFRGFITDYLAVLLAIQYGVTTKEDMQILAQKSYTLLKKNCKQVAHPMNVSEKIRNVMNGGYYGGNSIITGGRGF